MPSPVWALTMKVSSKFARAPREAISGNNAGGCTRSVLFRTSQQRRPEAPSRSAMSRTSSRRPDLASTSRMRQIGVGGAGPGGRNHRPVELALGPEDAGRIDQEHLRLGAHQDAQYAEPGGLGLW